MLSFENWDRLRAGPPVDPVTVPVETVLGQKRAVHNRLVAHPLVKRYVQHLKSPSPRNREPWHAMAEQYYAACLASMNDDPWLPGVYLDDTNGPDTDPDGLSIHHRGMGLTMQLLTAQPYLWSNHVHDLIRSSPLPPHTIDRGLMPYPLMFWSREAAVGPGRHPSLAGTESNWVLLVDHGDRVVIAMDVCSDRTVPKEQRRVTLAMRAIPYGLSYPDDFPHEAERETVGYLLKALAFLASPFVETRRARLPRPQRRELQREGKRDDPACEREVAVVVLRREAHESVAAMERDISGEGREWKHHWWVSGHFRAQYLPSTKSHRVIWIAPHLKGDLSKPLLEKVYAVVR